MSPKISDELASARRNQVLDAALSCFSRLGLDRATLRDISKESGLSLGTIYHYFRTKAELIEAIRRRSNETEEVTYLGSSPSPDSRQFFDFTIDFLFDRMNGPDSSDSNRVAVMLWAHSLLDELTLTGQLESLKAARAQVVSGIEALQHRGLVNKNLDAQDIGYVLLGLFMGVQIQKTWEPSIDGNRSAEVARAMLTGEFWTGENGRKPEGSQ